MSVSTSLYAWIVQATALLTPVLATIAGDRPYPQVDRLHLPTRRPPPAKTLCSPCRGMPPTHTDLLSGSLCLR